MGATRLNFKYFTQLFKKEEQPCFLGRNRPDGESWEEVIRGGPDCSNDTRDQIYAPDSRQWTQCAVGENLCFQTEQLSCLPGAVDSEVGMIIRAVVGERFPTLANLGQSFHHAVMFGRWEKAGDVLKEIQEFMDPGCVAWIETEVLRRAEGQCLKVNLSRPPAGVPYPLVWTRR